MNIVKVSMIGANENLPESDIIDFLHLYPLAEIGMGVSVQKGGYHTNRFDYIMSLLHEYNNRYVPNATGTIALHINGNGKDGENGWPVRVSRGDIPDEIFQMARFPKMSMQLNHRGYDFNAADAIKLSDYLCTHYDFSRRSRWILSYCDRTAEYINAFMNDVIQRNPSYLKWDILYDASFGRAQVSTQYFAPLYNGIRQGYAGGLGLDNITTELEKINAAQKNPNAEIWIDAEGKLQTDDKKTLDLNKAEQFYKKIMAHQNAQRLRTNA